MRRSFRNFMIIAFAVFPYVIGGIVMWFVAHQVAPVGYSISLMRGFCAVVLIGCGVGIADHFLRPVMGSWSYLPEIGVSALLAMVVLRLTFWRSLLVVVIYWVVLVIAVVVIALVFKAQGNTKLAASGNGEITRLVRFVLPAGGRLVDSSV